MNGIEIHELTKIICLKEARYRSHQYGGFILKFYSKILSTCLHPWKCRPGDADVPSVCAYVRVDEFHAGMNGVMECVYHIMTLLLTVTILGIGTSHT